jgi:group I intron endonuclease
MSKEIISGIYCFENLINGKKYIGQSVDLEDRKKRHFRDLNRGKDDSILLQYAWTKYGEENFKVYVIEYCLIEDLDKKETYYIKELHSHVSENGYNIAWGGDVPMRGRKHSEETKKKISDSSPDRNGENNPFYGKKHTKESLEKMSENHIDVNGEKNPMYGKNHTEETKQKMSENHSDMSGENHPLWGTHCSDETKKKISESNKGKTMSLESREKISEGNKGKKLSDETKKKISEGNKGKVRTEEVKKRISETKKGTNIGENNPNFGRKHTPEERKKISDAKKNSVGKRKSKNATSQYIGVSWAKKTKRWMAYGRINGKTKNLGSFINEIDAAKAYNKFAIEQYGKNAILNKFDD